MLGIPLSKIPVFKVGDLEGDTRAATDDNVVTLDRKWFNTHPNDVGGVIHEAVHAAQNLPDGAATDKQIEAMADAVRVRLHLDDYGWNPSPEAERLAALKPWQLRVASGLMSEGALTNKHLKAMETGQITRDDTTMSDEEFLSYVRGWDDPDAPGGDFDAGDDISGGNQDEDNSAAEAARRRRQRAQRVDKRNDEAAYVNLLSGYGIPTTPNIQALIAQGVRLDWDTYAFLNALRQTPEYAREFAGIMKNDGTMRMSEEQYLANKDQYEGYAQRYGINMGPQRMAWLFGHDVDPDEFADKAQALNQLNRNKGMYDAFKRELVQAGIAKPSDVDGKKELFKFVMGEGNKEWYDLMQDASTRYQAQQAGLTFAAGKKRLYTHLGQAVIERISGKDLTDDQMAAGFAEVEETLRKVLPLSEAKLYGVSKGDAVAAAFGGKGRSKALGDIERAQRTNEAYGEGIAEQRQNPDQAAPLPASRRRAQSYA
jgi:hypothetical protein